MILIDEETKCLSCGAAPPLEAVSAGHEGIHDHPHRVDHEHSHDHSAAAEGAELLRKLGVLLPHWIEHNAEHAGSFRAWAEEARASGAEHLAAHIEEAARRTEVTNGHLEGAVEHVDASISDHGPLHHHHF